MIVCGRFLVGRCDEGINDTPATSTIASPRLSDRLQLILSRLTYLFSRARTSAPSRVSVPSGPFTARRRTPPGPVRLDRSGRDPSWQFRLLC